MNKSGVIFAVATFALWGMSAFLDKLAANRLGDKGSGIILLASIPSIVLFGAYILLFRGTHFDAKGLSWLFVSWVLSVAGTVTYYLVFTRSQVSVGAPITAMYPALAVLLGVVVLHEKLSYTQIAGIMLSLISIYLLSK